MTEKDNKPKTQSGTPAGTGTGTKGGVNLEDLIKSYASMGGVVNEGPTTQDAEAAVQSIYNRIFGRNAVGAERTKAISIFLNQPAGVDVAGRQQAVISVVEETPEFRKRQENNYLDAIYNKVLQNVRGAQI
jgi:hypothetical protein